MILIHFQGTKISATDDGTPTYTPEYWTQDILDGIQSAFNDGDWETVPSPQLSPQPDWEGFNIAILTNTYWVNWSIMTDLRTSIISAAVSRLPDQLQAAYDLAKGLTPPSAEAIEAWQTIADQFNIPMEF